MNLTILGIISMQFLGTIYFWGGNDRRGFDCSGYILACLREIGFTLPDMTSHGIFKWASKKFNSECSPETPDALLFFGTSNRITHVALSIGGGFMLECGGSDRSSLSQSKEDLLRINACVRIKPISNRRDFVSAIPINY